MHHFCQGAIDSSAASQILHRASWLLPDWAAVLKRHRRLAVGQQHTPLHRSTCTDCHFAQGPRPVMHYNFHSSIQMAHSLQGTWCVKGATAIHQWYVNVYVRNSLSTELHLRVMTSQSDLLLESSFSFLIEGLHKKMHWRSLQALTVSILQLAVDRRRSIVSIYPF